MFCREQAARYGAHLDEIRGFGAQVVAIGNGTAEMARDFVDQFGVRFDVYTDPGKQSYRAAGFKHGLPLRVSMLKSGWRALRSGHVQGRTKGDPLQQGGTVVFDAAGEPALVHVDDTAGDHADVDEVLAVLRGLTRASDKSDEARS